MKHSKNQSFIEGKGFYIALCSCIAVLGLIAYIGSSLKKQDNMSKVSDSVIAEEPTSTPKIIMAISTPVPTIIPAKVTPKPSPTLSNAVQTLKQAQTIPPTPPKKVSYIMPCDGKIIGTFSESLVYNKTMDDWRTHNGIDIKADIGTDVKSVCDGKVEAVGINTLGNFITVSNGEYKFIYSNLAEESISLKDGDSVKKGGIIGKVGNTTIEEKSLDSHLHLEVLKDSENINPLDILK